MAFRFYVVAFNIHPKIPKACGYFLFLCRAIYSQQLNITLSDLRYFGM